MRLQQVHASSKSSWRYPVYVPEDRQMEKPYEHDGHIDRLFAGIQSDLDQVDALFQERATSGLSILNSASMHALASPGKRLRTALTLQAGKLNNYRFDKLLILSVAFEMVHLATLIHDDIIDEAKTRHQATPPSMPSGVTKSGSCLATIIWQRLLA